ncbi:MAG: hypothetical protein EOM05_03825 [Clostridia bacterium]|nr:hypothetical protein [Clostridia bacterium]
MMKKLYEYIIIFCIGAIGYGSIELLWRGFTHWTMIITGGIVLLTLYILNTKIIKGSLFKRCIIGCFTITGIEFVVGYIVNIVCKMNVWNYSKQPMQILGQICPLFTLLWFLLCIPATLLCMFTYKKIFKYDNCNLKLNE